MSLFRLFPSHYAFRNSHFCAYIPEPGGELGNSKFKTPSVGGRIEERGFMLTPKRIYEEELLDAGAGTDEDVEANLLDLRRINRFLGGTGVVLRALARNFDGRRADRVSLLDVGTGSADIPSEVARWCKSRGIA